MLKQKFQHTEWIEAWGDDYLRWVCGFANAQGGRLLLGQTTRAKTGNFMRTMEPLLSLDLMAYTLPDKPNSRLQKYKLTALGRQWLHHKNKV